MIQKLSKADVESIMIWLNSALSEKMSNLEETATTAEAETAMQAMKDKLLKDADRISLMQKLDEANRATQSNVELAIQIQYAMSASYAAMMDSNDPEMLNNIMKKIQANRSKMEKNTKDSTLTAFLYTYRTLEISELE